VSQSTNTSIWVTAGTRLQFKRADEGNCGFHQVLEFWSSNHLTLGQLWYPHITLTGCTAHCCYLEKEGICSNDYGKDLVNNKC
jgi:hypothetical protein